MDPAASVITIIEVSYKIARFMKDISEGGNERQMLLREILSVYQIFLSIQDRFSAEGWSSDAAWARSIRPLLEPEGVVDQLYSTLEELASKVILLPQDYTKRAKRAFLWPLESVDTQNIINRLNRSKMDITVVLGQANLELGNQSNASIAIVKDAIVAQTFVNVLDWLLVLDFRAVQ